MATISFKRAAVANECNDVHVAFVSKLRDTKRLLHEATLYLLFCANDFEALLAMVTVDEGIIRKFQQRHGMSAIQQKLVKRRTTTWR